MLCLSTVARMSPNLVLLQTASLVSAEKCTSSPGSRIELSLSSVKNSTGHWITTVDARRSTLAEDQRELTVNVQQETKLCGSSEIEQLVSMTSVYPSLNDSSTGSCTASATATSSPTTAPSTTTRTEAAPMTCPHHSGYQQFPGFSCYKLFPLYKTWSEAREVCRRDGGDLMVVETDQEREEVYIPLRNSTRFRYDPWIGVYRPQGEESWISINGGPAPSSWWYPRYPVKDTALQCAVANDMGLLWNYDCEDTRPFFCEIPL